MYLNKELQLHVNLLLLLLLCVCMCACDQLNSGYIRVKVTRFQTWSITSILVLINTSCEVVTRLTTHPLRATLYHLQPRDVTISASLRDLIEVCELGRVNWSLLMVSLLLGKSFACHTIFLSESLLFSWLNPLGRMILSG